MTDRISTFDNGYISGDLSVFPEALDSTTTLYEVANNAETITTQRVSYGGKFIVVEDASIFPSKGILLLGTELIYYDSRTGTVFKDLKRGFAGTRQNVWPSKTKVTNSVSAEIHNAVKDAIINMETNLGLKENPTATSLNGILKSLENRFLAPKPLFRAFPLIGAPPLTVRFQNFSDGDPLRFLWDFGDGGTSSDTDPTHTYVDEGIYSVELSIVTGLNAQGKVTKSNYITVSNNEKLPIFYVDSLTGSASVTQFNFVDQTSGVVVTRYWVWDDGTNTVVEDPDIHTASHVYANAGEYEPSLLAVFEDTTQKRLLLGEKITVT